ncbi:hypothetical protein KEU06_09320 [Pseudaminobacter sp. 19-2017]|uniref:Uncharacterized protein n=1 Tax=Pseudaminobacter soli (ex Zhang et al. 2022) TaxID=2831468 RepID=A0A942DWA9_9HYPH|nr:hypothetical protein [Pseudaminobacter soli]MBS3648804.1 hypothetical protein [Pseudaminobacter soli]
MKKMNWDDEMRTHVPSMFITEDDDDEVELVDTGRVDKDGVPIIIALSHKQGFAGFLPPGMYERIQQAKEEAEAKAELTEMIEEIVTVTLKKIGIKLPPPAPGPAPAVIPRIKEKTVKVSNKKKGSADARPE